MNADDEKLVNRVREVVGRGYRAPKCQAEYDINKILHALWKWDENTREPAPTGEPELAK